jgi:hypothetical protein
MSDNDTTRFFRRLIDACGYPRINRALGDNSKVDPDAPPGVRLQQRHATMTTHEKIESLARITDFVENTCDYCGGWLPDFDHAEDCEDPDQIEWRRIKGLSPEELDAELRAEGLDPDESRERFRSFLDELEAKAIARIQAEGAEG